MERETLRAAAAAADYYSLYEQRNATNLGELIDMALDAIEEANNEKLEGVFRNINFNSEAALGQTKQRNARLKNLLQDFADPRLDMRPSRINGLDVIGNAYEYLIGKFAADAGQKGRRVLHPARSLAAAGETARPPARRAHLRPGLRLRLAADQVRGGSRQRAITPSTARRTTARTWALAMMNMFLHDINQPRHRVGRHASTTRCTWKATT